MTDEHRTTEDDPITDAMAERYTRDDEECIRHDRLTELLHAFQTKRGCSESDAPCRDAASCGCFREATDEWMNEQP